MKHVVQFSGGLCSFWAAHRVIQRYGKDAVTLLFADTKMEDEDLYRFNKDTETALGVPITTVSDGRSVWDLFDQKGMLGNSRFPLCSVILKREVLDCWRFANTTADSHIFHLGLDWTEGHRMNGFGGNAGMLERFKPWVVTAPMMDAPIWDKCKMQREWTALGFKLPRLYELGFPHNNCGGFCVKAGQAQFAKLLQLLPERFAFHEAKEQAMRDRTGKDYSILSDRRGDGKKKVLTLRTLRERIVAGESFDRDDWGGCGCATI
jgi:hypothetical protein